jgi:hypothetical protein
MARQTRIIKQIHHNETDITDPEQCLNYAGMASTQHIQMDLSQHFERFLTLPSLTLPN